MQLGDFIRQLRKERGFTADELAVACRLSTSTMSRIETKSAVGYMSTMRRIYLALHGVMPLTESERETFARLAQVHINMLTSAGGTDIRQTIPNDHPSPPLPQHAAEFHELHRAQAGVLQRLNHSVGAAAVLNILLALADALDGLPAHRSGRSAEADRWDRADGGAMSEQAAMVPPGFVYGPPSDTREGWQLRRMIPADAQPAAKAPARRPVSRRRG
jgi:transcriptional regulator with XRE-family HTH domain